MIFIAITMLGLYGLQNILIYFLTHGFTAPSDWCFSLLEWLSSGTFSKEFVRLNFAKVIATIASLTWNYILYSRLVFKPNSGASSQSPQRL